MKGIRLIGLSALAVGILASTPSNSFAKSASERHGGSAQRALGKGTALAQSFYERSVLFAKQRRFGDAVQLMGRAVDKNPYNEKYRYFLSLLFYKSGDLGESALQAKKLSQASNEKYRLKSRALLNRIDLALQGQIPMRKSSARPVSSRSYPQGPSLQALPDNAYFNVAQMARGMSKGRNSVSNLVRSAKAPAKRYSEPVYYQETQIADARMGDPSMSKYGWIDPKDLKPKKIKKKAKKKAKTKVITKAPKAEIDTADAFADVWDDEATSAKAEPVKEEPEISVDEFEEPAAVVADDTDDFGDDFGEEPAAAVEESVDSFEEAAAEDPPAAEDTGDFEEDSFGDDFEAEDTTADSEDSSDEGDFGDEDFEDF